MHSWKRILRAYELYKKAPEELFDDMLSFVRDTQRALYDQSILTLTKSRKLRPVFVLKKPVKEQFSWIKKTLRLLSHDVLGEHLLQVWFMNAHSQLLIDFCDGVGIEHDENGHISNDLPEAIEADVLDKTVEELIEKYDKGLFALYLHVFNLQRPEGWASLTKKLEEDKRLQFQQIELAK